MCVCVCVSEPDPSHGEDESIDNSILSMMKGLSSLGTRPFTWGGGEEERFE